MHKFDSCLSNSKEEYTKYRESTSVLIPMVGYQYVPLFLKRSAWVRYCGSKVPSKKGVSFNFHDSCLVNKNSSFLKIDTLSEKNPWDLRSMSAKSIGHFSSHGSSSINSLLSSPGHFSSTIRSTNTIPKSQAKRRKSEERVSRERENPQIHGRI